MGNTLHLTLRYQRNAGATARTGGTSGQYVFQLPDIVNIDTKRISTCTATSVADQTISPAICGSGYVMHAVGTSAGIAECVLHDSDAKTFRVLVRRIDDDQAAGDHFFMSSSNTSAVFSFGGASTALSMTLELSIPVTD
jgi:hypothetical protein